ncbi:MAG: hypothetical protein AAGJ83_00420 [Planctomycetota bacterium]
MSSTHADGLPAARFQDRCGDPKLSRRSGLLAIATGLLAGCKSEPVVESQPTSVSSVPLRIGIYEPGDASSSGNGESLTVVDDGFADSIRRVWALASEQPIEIVPLNTPAVASGPDADSSAIEKAMASQALGVDVMIFPQRMLGTYVQFRCLVGLSAEVLTGFETELGKTLPSVRNGLGIYGGESYGVAGGAKVFAFLASDPEATCVDWEAYDAWVTANEGLAAEPLADGWAATSFLHRCATSLQRDWLFDRNTFRPFLDSQEYRDVLSLMKQTADRYVGDALDPAGIWRAIRQGTLSGGIGYEVSNADDEIVTEMDEPLDVSISNSPALTEATQIWFPPSTPIVALSVGCRQTDASKRMIGWLSGGEQVESLWRTTERFSPTRKRDISEANRQRPSSNYLRWLETRLTAVQVQTPLCVPFANQYHEALDDEVLACLAGRQSPEAALRSVSARWEAITDVVGRKQQTAAWKRARGFGG